MPPAPTAPLPENWVEKKDSRGRAFYVNQRTKTTTWERPLASESPRSGDDQPPPYTRPAPATQRSRAWRAFTCTPSITFWVVAVLGWVVWVLAVSATSDDQWFREGGYFFAGDEDLLDQCEANELTGDFCNLYVTFTTLQFMAVSVASVSVILLVVALFRPATGKLCSAYSLGIAGGTLMAVYALFQMLAFVIIVIIEKTEKTLGGSRASTEDPGLGATFGVAAAGVLLAMLQAGVVLVFARGSGDGPFYKCINNVIGQNSRSMPVSGGPMPQPPRPVARTPERIARTGTQPPVSMPPAQAPIPNPDYHRDVEMPTRRTASPAVHSQVVSGGVQSPVASPISQPTVANQAAQSPALASPDVESPVVSRSVESTVASQAAQTALASRAVESPVLTQPVESAVESPAVQSPVASSAVESAVASPAVPSRAESPAVKPSVASPVVDPPSPSVESPVSTQAVQAAVASPVVQAAVASPHDERAGASQAAQSPTLSPTVQSPKASPAVQSTVASLDVEPAVASPSISSPGENPAVQLAVVSPVVDPPIPSVESIVSTPAVQPAVVSPAVQPAEVSPDAELAVASEAAQSPASGPPIQSPVTSPVVQSPVASLDVEPAVASVAVQHEVASPDVESPNSIHE